MLNVKIKNFTRYLKFQKKKKKKKKWVVSF